MQIAAQLIKDKPLRTLRCVEFKIIYLLSAVTQTFGRAAVVGQRSVFAEALQKIRYVGGQAMSRWKSLYCDINWEFNSF